MNTHFLVIRNDNQQYGPFATYQDAINAKEALWEKAYEDTKSVVITETFTEES
jgi:hypothetical protein